MSTNAEESRGQGSSTPDAEEFPTPPRAVTDGEDRMIRFECGDGSAAERESLAAMYDAFGTADRAQGIPPANPRRREQWLDHVSEGVTVVAWHGDRAIGHGVLLDGEDDYELALFVHPGYRQAGVGSGLLRTLLGRGRSAGVERVWLSVQRTNRPAIHLYREAGFRAEVSGNTADSDLGMAMEMRRSLR